MTNIQPPIFSVTEFHALVNNALNQNIGEILIQGEISDLRTSRGKWLSFDLKDDESAVSCFAPIFKVSVPLEEGMKVKILGKPRIYPKYGKYSFQIIAVEPIGEGSIKKAYEALLKKLEAEELFDEKFKLPLPKYPETIGLITSKDGAAITDVKRILRERWGGFRLLLKPVAVQGISAETEVIEAINYFNHHLPTDLIILTRGGGSMEDLQAFNSELMARTIFASRIPIIAAIGHERDIAIAEMVSDKRAATPSNAAQLAVPDRKTIQLEISDADNRLKNYIKKEITTHNVLMQHAEKLALRLLSDANSKLNDLQKILNSLSPERVLERGYTITKQNGRVVKNPKNLKRRDKIETIFKSGKITSEVL